MIQLSSDTVTAGGTNGLYWRYDKITGIKVCLRDDETTRREANWLKKLNRLVPGLFPDYKGLVVVNFDGVKSLGFQMEHITGLHKYVDFYSKYQHVLIDRAVQQLYASGLIFEDVAGNVIIQRGNRVRFIDADPNYFTFVEA